MSSRTWLLAAMLGLAAPLLGACKADNASGYHVQVDILLSDDLSPTTTVEILEDGSDFGSSIKNATVMLQLNGGTPTQVPYRESFGYLLDGNISGAEPKGGDTVAMDITIGSKSMHDAVSVPATPKIAPTTAQDAGKAITLTWEAASTPPGELQIAIVDKYTAAENPMGYFENIPGSSTSYTIPAGTLKPATKEVYVQVTAQNTHQLTGADYEPYSHFMIASATGLKLDTL